MSIFHVPSQKAWPESIKKVELDTGINMAYQEMGDTDKPAIIMLHGFSDSSRATRMIASHLVNDYHMYAVDLRGHGRTDKPKQFAYPAYQHMQDIQSFARKLNITRFTILGISMGSFAAQCVAYAMPEAVEAVILVASGARLRHSGAETEEMRATFENFQRQTPAIEDLVPTCAKFDDQEYLEEMYKEVLNWPAYCWQAAWFGMEITDNTKFLQYIKAPTICMWGTEDDTFTKECQEEMLNNIPNVEGVWFDGGSHEIQQEKHEEIAENMKRFLEKHEKSS